MMVVEDLLWEEDDDGSLFHVAADPDITLTIITIRFQGTTWYSFDCLAHDLPMAQDLWKGFAQTLEEAKERAASFYAEAYSEVKGKTFKMKKAVWETTI
ncbi:MAG: hypothetical protein KAS32_14745 [Candidatus Peribacteraceae bacterium]|nr:hypothetical protein [Candidatus Peribacteraceae bacterium]